MSSQTPQNIVTTYQYDGLYREISEIDPRKGTSSTAYFTSGAGENGQVSSHTDAGGNATSYTYDSTDGRLFSQTDPLGDIVYDAYDHEGREIKTWGTGTFPVEYAFDAYGAQIAMRTFRSTSLNFSSSTWPLSDDGGDPQNPIPTSWTNGDTTSWAFDPATGLLTSKKDAAGQSVVYTYNPNATLAKRTWARGVSTTYSYDPNTAEQIGISYSDGSPGLTYTFDRLGHGSSVVQAYSGSTLTTGLQYNVPGKLTQETLDSSYFSGRQLVYQLDTSNAGTLGRTIGYQMGTSASPSLDEGSSLAYDTDGRLNAVGLTGGPTFSYAFAANSNLIGSVTDSPDNWTQARTWDTHRDLLDLVQTSVGSTVEGAFTYALDALGRRTSKLQTGSLFSRYPATGLVDAYTYDSKSEVTADQAYQSNNPASLTTKVLGRGFTFAYDPIGNRTTSAVDATQTTSYTENALNQITSRTVPGYYAASGFAPTGATVTLNGTAIPSGQFAGQYYLENVTATNSSAPLWLTAQSSSSLGGSVTANAFVPQTPEASTYDADGNILTDGRWNYFWDAENRLKAIETFGNQAGNSKSIWNSGVPLIHIDFKYDYKGRRISKLISTWSGSAFVASSETRYAYENWNLLADYSVSGGSLSLAHSYLWGIDLSGKIHGAGGVGGLLAMISSSGAIELPVYDGNGNVQALTDRATAQMTAAYEYSPYGQPLRIIGTDALVNPFRFSTKYTDNETDLVYYGRRYYNPAIGRFLGRDPKQEKGGLHLYAFVQNDVVNGWDVLGRSPTNGSRPSWLPPWLFSGDNSQSQINSSYQSELENNSSQTISTAINQMASTAGTLGNQTTNTAINAGKTVAIGAGGVIVIVNAPEELTGLAVYGLIQSSVQLLQGAAALNALSNGNTQLAQNYLTLPSNPFQATGQLAASLFGNSTFETIGNDVGIAISLHSDGISLLNSSRSLEGAVNLASFSDDLNEATDAIGDTFSDIQTTLLPTSNSQSSVPQIPSSNSQGNGQSSENSTSTSTTPTLEAGDPYDSSYDPNDGSGSPSAPVAGFGGGIIGQIIRDQPQ
jgi:RHS repeat-associated protein